MLSASTKTFRIKAAIVLVALYALCCLAPAAAFAFSDNPDVAHCLIEGYVGIHKHGAKLHVHADGTTHQHHGDGATHQHHDDGAAPSHASDGDKSAVATCCGLFSVLAIPGEPELSPGLYSLASVVAPVPGAALSGRGPERINRPPIS